MLYKVNLDFTLHAVLEIDADDAHAANESVGQLETSLIDEVNNWGLSEIRELRIQAHLDPAEQHG
jgi:hypothetical protein